MKKLKHGFFNRHTVTVAKGLLGKYLVRRINGRRLAGKIVEVEAYRGKDDPGSHAFHKRTKRNEVMFGPAGRAYVYFCYGNHYLFNIVTEKQNEAGAVLIRALEPACGIEEMKKRRGTKNLLQLTSGPAKLTQALGIGRDENRMRLDSGALYAAEAGRKEKFAVAVSQRIGIKRGLNLKWRFFIKGNRHVSV